ncbi:Na+/proline symporter [Acetomicrobium mobile DSM 13181]|uniref:Na+/proline symporter n=1 Tax=Acetomicrobium mobile (strain ATCC BAA-54 / DSM 13181 / JCM 12221 / NGA) TaxID=891968 RepID=I4BYQ9_ACEMN|nr:sodium:solute symporter family protein [Acetomicrobium mobile]AFM22416.1 Na+/proline symporter [Acetomicrobium mobile DSM 13181]
MLLIVIAYMALMLLVGWWAGKFYVKGMTDFLLAGRRLGVILCSATLAATHFGGGAVMGGGEYGFKYGMSGAWYGVSCGIGLIILGLVTARRFRDLAFYTVPDYLERRYGGKTIRVLGSLLSLVALVGILAAQVLSARGALGILGITGNTGAVVATLVFIIYTTSGGLWAVTLTDLIQMTWAAVGVILASNMVLGHTGGYEGLKALLQAKAVGPEYMSFWGMGTAGIMWLLLPTVMYTLIGQDFYQRLFAAKDGKTAKVSSLVGGIVLVVVSFFPALMGMGARALANLEDPSMAVPWVLQNLMGPLLGGLILAAILAAIMSTADSLLSAATSHIVKDFWIEIFHLSEVDHEKELLRVSRIFTFVIGVLALIIALIVPGIIDALIYSYTMYTAGVFVPVIGGFLWKGATRAGAFASLIIGSIVALWGILSGVSLFGAPVEIFAALISLVIFVVVSLITKK